MRYEVNAVMQYSRSNKLAECRLKDTIVLLLPTDRFKLEQATHDKSQKILNLIVVTQKGTLLLAMCKASATLEGP